MKNYIWLWCLFNTICVFLLTILYGINFSINDKYQNKIDENQNKIENIEYKLNKNDTIIIINNINYKQNENK